MHIFRSFYSYSYIRRYYLRIDAVILAESYTYFRVVDLVKSYVYYEFIEL